MYQNANFSIVFNRRNKLNKNGQAAIEIIVYHNGKRKYFSTGLNIEPRFWDQKNNSIRQHPEAYKLNKILEDKLKSFKNIELSCILKNTEFNIEMLNNNISGSFTEFFRNEIEGRENIKNTSKTTALVAYKSFEKFAGNVKFSQIDYKLIVEYDNWLRREYVSGHTVQTRHKVLKTYLNIAIKRGLIERNDYPYLNFKLTEAKTNRLDLSFAEIEKLENLDLNEKILIHSRDLFLFSVYTGLRYEDVQELKPSNIFVQKNETELRKIIIKTGDELRLPLSYLFNGKAINLIENYKNYHPEFCFPQYANQTINRSLKVIQYLIKFNGTLFFHIARHTFGSRIAELTPDGILIMKLMGHKDIKTSMLYIKTSGKVVENKLKELKW